jgi:hypothetical protein
MFPRHFKQGLPISELLLQRVRKTPESDFSMLALLEDLQHGDSVLNVRTRLALAKQACRSNVYILKVHALELLQRLSHEVHMDAPDELPSIRLILESFDSNNIMLNTALIETLSAYDFVEPPVSVEAALDEMKAVIPETAADDPALAERALLGEVSPEQFLADRAYSLLSNIFEDVFQGVYCEAYNSLGKDEKRAILCRAANASRPGMFTDWVLRELLQYGGESALPIYQRFASVPDGQSFCPQESVAAFVLGVYGCAKQGGTLPAFSSDASADVQAWRTIGEILFSCVLNNPVRDEIWDRLTGPVRVAAADVLYMLQHSQWRAGAEPTAIDLVTRYPEQIRPILDDCLRHRSSLSSIFQYGGSRDPNVLRFVITALGSIGDEGSASILTALADDPSFGRDVIAALESIHSRRLQLGYSTSA